MNRSARRVLLRLFLLALPLVVLTLFATSLLSSSSSSNADSVHNTAALTFASEGKRYLSFQEPLSTLENPTTRVTPSSLSGWMDGWMEFFLLLFYDLYNILLDVGFLLSRLVFRARTAQTRWTSSTAADRLIEMQFYLKWMGVVDVNFFFIFIFSDRLQFSRAGPISCLQHRLTRNYSDNFNSWSKSSVNLKIDFDYKVCVCVLILMIPNICR